mgnify:CR=1 FL=1
METAAIMRMKELVQKLDRAAKAYLPAGYRDHKQQRVRSDVRRASGSGERDRHCSGKQPNHKRRVRGS